jgi:hypothetical protein
MPQVQPFGKALIELKILKCQEFLRKNKISTNDAYSSQLFGQS